MTNAQPHRYSDYSNLYDDGYDDFVAGKVKMSKKKAKRKVTKPDPLHINSGDMCLKCRARSVFDGKCLHCDKPSKKAIARKVEAEKS